MEALFFLRRPAVRHTDAAPDRTGDQRNKNSLPEHMKHLSFSESILEKL